MSGLFFCKIFQESKLFFIFAFESLNDFNLVNETESLSAVFVSSAFVDGFLS